MPHVYVGWEVVIRVNLRDVFLLEFLLRLALFYVFIHILVYSLSHRGWVPCKNSLSECDNIGNSGKLSYFIGMGKLNILDNCVCYVLELIPTES